MIGGIPILFSNIFWIMFKKIDQAILVAKLHPGLMHFILGKQNRLAWLEQQN